MRRVLTLAACAGLLILISSNPAAAQEKQGGFLKTKVSPGRAGVFVDGKYVGPAANFGISRKYALPVGPHQIRLTEPRYEDLVMSVAIEGGKTTKLVETMKRLPDPKPPFGRLRTISDDKFAAVFVNGKYMGHVDEFSNSAQGLLLNPGEYKVKVSPVNGPEGKEEVVRIEADKVAVVRAGK